MLNLHDRKTSVYFFVMLHIRSFFWLLKANVQINTTDNSISIALNCSIHTLSQRSTSTCAALYSIIYLLYNQTYIYTYDIYNQKYAQQNYFLNIDLNYQLL